MELFVNGIKLERVTHFNYLGRRVEQNDNDSNCIMTNIKKARKQWASIAKLLKREGANAVTMARFYITVVQSILLYGAESWTPKQTDMSKLRSFHHRAVRYMTGIHIVKKEEEWIIPDHEVLLKKCRLLEIEHYLEARRYTLKGYMEENHPTFFDDISDISPPAKNNKKILWWNQATLTKQEMNILKNTTFCGSK